MNELGYNLYQVTRNEEHLRLAGLFDKAAFFDPLTRGADVLSGIHANTHLAQVRRSVCCVWNVLRGLRASSAGRGPQLGAKSARGGGGHVSRPDTRTAPSRLWPSVGVAAAAAVACFVTAAPPVCFSVRARALKVPAVSQLRDTARTPG
jgi:Beta-L-arabinofuranosidase, GH127